MSKEIANRISQTQELLRGKWVNNPSSQTLTFISPPFPEGYGEWRIEELSENPSLKKITYFIDIEGEDMNEIIFLRTNIGGAEKGTNYRIWVDEIRLAIEYVYPNGSRQMVEYFRPS